MIVRFVLALSIFRQRDFARGAKLNVRNAPKRAIIKVTPVNNRRKSVAKFKHNVNSLGID